ncbi:MAG: 4Fe-4S cluster-binding domain-containing protein, partial [Acidobacteria bacterium]|nr:4Fe-4S cluster-binding domain-containing protein [Acidobacteriota bacterium]
MLAGLSLTLTERCNWRCRYCPRVRGTNTLEAGTLDQACAALFPYLSSSPLIQFCGGEPLLAFHLIRRAIEQLEKRSRDSRTLPRSSLTTTGSLLRPEILSFLEAHRFALMLSFDGPSQDQERRKGSYRRLTAVLDELPAYPGIRPATHSVFGPRTVGTLADTIAFLVDRRVPEI